MVSIVIVSSVSAHIGQVSHANYASTKGGNLAFSRALAMELAPWHIRVNSISPGATDTPMLQSDVAKEAAIEEQLMRKSNMNSNNKGLWDDGQLLKKWHMAFYGLLPMKPRILPGPIY